MCLKMTPTEEKESNFYTKAIDYWKDISPTNDGMLGGYGHISQIDIQGSRHFLQHIFQQPNNPGRERALDCGSGIGRITKHLLSHFFAKVDLVEQNPHFLEQAKLNLIPKCENIGEYYAKGLQEFIPEHKYDIIWCQWVLGHLTDEDLVNFFTNCRKSLAENGLIIIKENVTSSGDDEMDDKDSSLTRSYQHLIELFEKSLLKCVKKHKQSHFPKELYTVYMFALNSASNT